MKSFSIKEIKSELKELDSEALVDICLRLAKYKKENKELMSYLLFDAHNERSYIEQIKENMGLMFEDVPIGSNAYYIKKTLRKILRFALRQIRYSGIASTEIELRIHFCLLMRGRKIPMHAGSVLSNIYQQQLKKISGLINKLPEDSRLDYEDDLSRLR
jgi:hypothetical protein